MKTFELVGSPHQKSAFNELTSIDKHQDGESFLNLYESDTHLIFYRINKGLKADTENQTEIPIEALAWIKDVIINGFWKKPSEGGLPKDQHASKAVIEDEEIIVSRSMNAGEPGKPGFKIANKSRTCHIASFMNQEFQITDELLESEVFQVFDRLVAN